MKPCNGSHIMVVHHIATLEPLSIKGFKYFLHGKKLSTCSGLMKTRLKNVVLPTLFTVNNIAEPESGVTMLNNIEQCGQQNIVYSCFHQP